MSENTETNSQEAQTPEQNAAAPQVESPAAASSVQRPEGLAENFWDSEKNEIKINDLISSYSELSKFKTETDAKFSGRPESPDKYELRIPEGFELPEGVGFDFDEKSPLVEAARKMAFESGSGQEGFDQLVSTYMKEKLSAFQQEATEIEETYQAELAKLGERSKDRLDAATNFLKSNLSESQYNAIRKVASTADGVTAIEALMALSRDKAPVIPGNGGGEGLSETDLHSMMKDPKYWRDRDPAFIKKVTDGYQKLYPNKVATSV
ncbi:MAG: hypothetical protein E6R03_10565 [Hyphomicrobiaceae bacterium]|nr:MAG: hypothetical protein E6R03_10565 [Hyphomicrobiaceae bacterium]